MFYDSLILSDEEVFELKQQQVSGIAVLTPAESKRLIAKAVAVLPEVQAALKKGRVVIAGGTTNAFVAEELLGVSLSKVHYTAGVISSGELGVTASEGRIQPYILVNGRMVDVRYQDIIREFEVGDVFIKGANAIDMYGNAGVIVAGDSGGTIGTVLPTLLARGAHLIMPVGLEKLVPSVIEASERCGIGRFKYATGVPVGLIPVVNGKVVTEIQALEILAGVISTHVASGGVGGSEGAVVLAIEGLEEEVAEAFELIRSIKGEPALPAPQMMRRQAQ